MAPPKPERTQLVSEFVGTYLLVFAVGCNVITGTAAWAVTSIACTLMVSIYALGGISGAHFNPAVTFAFAMSNQLGKGFDTESGIKHAAPKFMAAQLVGGILAGLSYAGLFWDVFNLEPAAGFNGLHAGMAEFFYTFLLVFCVLNCAASEGARGTEYYGLAIGFSVIAGGYGAGHISGGCFNPAVAVGIDVSSAGVGFGWCLIYILFELAGSAVAVLLHKALRPSDYVGVNKPTTPGMRYLSEFVGTFFLVLTVGLNVIGGSLAPVWSIAASLMCVIFCLGGVSGGHFNPAVSMAVYVANRGAPGGRKEMPLYMVVQCAAGLVAAVTYSIMEKGSVFPLAPGVGHTWLSAYLAEFIFTFMLCFVVLSVACVPEKQPCAKSFFAFAIASCVMAGGCAIGAISGGSLNPAVSTGIALSSMGRGHGIFHVFPYIIFELLGGVAAGLLHQLTHEGTYKKLAQNDQEPGDRKSVV